MSNESGTASKIRVTVWNEYMDEQKQEKVTCHYPQGLHTAIADFLNGEGDISAKTSLIGDPEQGLAESTLQNTDVLIWWGHVHHGDVEDSLARRVMEHVQGGMGIIFLHSAHKSKPFTGLLGTDGYISWREAEEKCRVWTASPAHPIAAGIPESFVIEHEEMYSEPFGVPEPASTVFISWFKGGNVFRSGLTFERGFGKIFYFQPGHETYPNYHNEYVRKVIVNAVRWAKPELRITGVRECPRVDPLERLD
ncbi:MAG: ThuA domain-containing protein [Treponema sp.]|nr:ThuA domain-containing protein [Treponema sp.]